MVQLTSDTAHCKAVAASEAALRVDMRGIRAQVVSMRRRATSSRPPVAKRRAKVDLTVRVIVVPGTQEVKGEVSKLISLRGNIVGISGCIVAAYTFCSRVSTVLNRTSMIFLDASTIFEGGGKGDLVGVTEINSEG